MDPLRKTTCQISTGGDGCCSLSKAFEMHLNALKGMLKVFKCIYNAFEEFKTHADWFLIALNTSMMHLKAC